MLLDTPTGVTTTVGVSGANVIGMSIPDAINYGTLVYLGLLILHKGWQMYKEWRDKDESSK